MDCWVDAEEKLLAHRRIENDCWIWTGGVDEGGYGVTRWRGGRWKVHRLAYSIWIGPLDPSLIVDHVKARGCRSRACMNPAHLEQVTMGTNNGRGGSPSALNAMKTHCPQGHEFTPENTRYEDGARTCRICRNAYHRERYTMRREAENQRSRDYYRRTRAVG